MRPLTASLAAVALAAALSAALLCGCSDPGGLRVTGQAQQPTAGPGPVGVSEGPGKPSLRRPAAFAASAALGLSDLRWRSWGGPTAEGRGSVRGTWCLPECRDRPYRAKVTLSGLVRQGGAAYYSRVTVDAADLPTGRRTELRDVPLHVPER
ncbi:hypothetical protein ACFQ2B_12375 [Streptomyces stramineus]|uniref:Lipoprotein n=1 Tax=Streptomyces stramineus TaxID=173861 RepID=A0ABN1AFT4_9ACTN